MDGTAQRRMVDTAQRSDSPQRGDLAAALWRTCRAPARSPPLPSTTSAWMTT
jgi:hypothetical protein